METESQRLCRRLRAEGAVLQVRMNAVDLRFRASLVCPEAAMLVVPPLPPLPWADEEGKLLPAAERYVAAVIAVMDEAAARLRTVCWRPLSHAPDCECATL